MIKPRIIVTGATGKDNTQTALDWFKATDFPANIGNLARNIRENRLGVLSAVLTRDGSLSPPAGC